MADARRKEAAARVASRWLSGLKSRRVRQPSRLRLTVWLTGESDSEAIAKALTSCGAESTSLAQGSDPPGAQTAAAWPQSITACFPAEHTMLVRGLREVDRMARTPGHSVLFQAEAVMDASWANSREDVYIPVEVQRNFWLVPVWCDIPEPGALNILLEPTYAAWPGKGTVDGLQHPATILVLKHLASSSFTGHEQVMDYGIGSGVLAIAALKFGAGHVVGVDIDPVCVTTSQKNMARNGIPDTQFEVLCGGDILEEEPLKAAGMKTQAFDVCMANVLEGDMQRLRMRLLSYLKPGGLFILSGMLTDQVPEVMQNFSPFLSDVETEEMSGWTRISGHISETVAPEEGRH